MQRIREDSNGEVGFLEAMIISLQLKLSAHDLYPKYDIDKDRYMALIDFGEFDISINDNGSSYVLINFCHIQISDGLEIANSIFNPEVILNKIVKVAVFANSLKPYFIDIDRDWLAHGIKCVINGSGDLIIKHDPYIPTGDPLKMRLYSNYPTNDVEFKQQYHCKAL